MASRSELITHTKMLIAIKDRIAELKKQGKTLTQIQAAHPAKEWEVSHNWDFINNEKLVESIYQSLP